MLGKSKNYYNITVTIIIAMLHLVNKLNFWPTLTGHIYYMISVFHHKYSISASSNWVFILKIVSLFVYIPKTKADC